MSMVLSGYTEGRMRDDGRRSGVSQRVYPLVPSAAAAKQGTMGHPEDATEDSVSAEDKNAHS